MRVTVEDDAGFELYSHQCECNSILQALHQTAEQLQQELLRLGELHIRANPK